MPETVDTSELPFVFLGLARKAAVHGYGLDILGVANTWFLPFFPHSLQGLRCLIGVRKDFLFSRREYEYKLIFTEEKSPTTSAWTTQRFVLQRVDTNPENQGSKLQRVVPIQTPPSQEGFELQLNYELEINQGDEPGAYEIIPSPAPPLQLNSPGVVLVDIEVGSQRHRLGKLLFRFVEPPPILETERRAIASRPDAANAIVTHIQCSKCEDELWCYAALDPTKPMKKSPAKAVALQNTPDEWRCECGNCVMDLTFIKRGIHDLFRRPRAELVGETFGRFRPLYEKGELSGIARDYQSLINSSPREEDVQKFMEAHPVFWAFLSPVRIFHKPPILTKKVADFAVLTSQNILYLVEIEKPQTPLSTKKGKLHSELNQGFDQIRDWSVVVATHRTALLDELGLRDEKIVDIRYLVIAGLAHMAEVDVLAKIQQNPPTAKTQFFCFDELAAFLHILEAQINDTQNLSGELAAPAAADSP